MREPNFMTPGNTASKMTEPLEPLAVVRSAVCERPTIEALNSPPIIFISRKAEAEVCVAHSAYQKLYPKTEQRILQG